MVRQRKHIRKNKYGTVFEAGQGSRKNLFGQPRLYKFIAKRDLGGGRTKMIYRLPSGRITSEPIATQDVPKFNAWLINRNLELMAK